jgi:glutamate synthase (ferredoxin)
LYDPRFEHDACGIGFVARLSGSPSHAILKSALAALANVAHRGGVSADGKSGDGAGVLTQIPRAFFRRELARLQLRYSVAEPAVGMLFLPRKREPQALARRIVEWGFAQYGLPLLGWRAVPVDPEALGAQAAESCPAIEQVFVGRPSRGGESNESFELSLYLARKAIEQRANADGITGFLIPSLSSRTIVYKGLLTAPMLGRFYPDLRDPLYKVALAVYHQRYSTNTFPTWERAQPFRMLSHNGEINTLGGNVAWMRAREMAWRRAGTMDDRRPTTDNRLAERVASLGPIVDTRGSDSAMLDNVLELVVMGGRDIRHAIAMMVPEAWEGVRDIDPDLRKFYEYHACLMEPWDGPAALAFSDGQVVGLALDRNGLRPARYLLTSDGLVVCGSEAGSVALDEASIVRKGKLGPGQMIEVDLRTGEFLENDAIKKSLADAHPYDDWVRSSLVTGSGNLVALTDDRPQTTGDRSRQPSNINHLPLEELQHAFGYTSEELNVIIRPMLEDGVEPVGSMGDDTPSAFIAERARPLYAYFKQRFAEVTNPPIDPLREQMVMSLSMYLGSKGDLLSGRQGPANEHARMLRIASPVLTDRQLAAILNQDDPAFRSAGLSALFAPGAESEKEGATALRSALDRLRLEAEQAAEGGAHLLVISDREVCASRAAIPALLALGAVHDHLIERGLRRRVGLIVESGEPREVHHVACLLGMGAEAVNPYLAIATARHIAQERSEIRQRKATSTAASARQHEEADPIDPEQAERNYVHALEKGLLKVMSKMGIATMSAYCGAQVFEAIGLGEEVIESCFAGLPARLGGVGFEKLARDAARQHNNAFGVATPPPLPNPGFYKYKKDGEYHAYSPPVVQALQKSVKGAGDYEAYRAYSDLVQDRPPTELRDLLDFVPREPVPLEEIEPVEAIVWRFSTAAMSLGSTSSEAHETIAIAMNRLGGLSNSGEGGEDPARFGGESNSPIKQVASARFGVTPAYLVSARELQIKMAQGSKPGEGGQLPAHKVSEEIARIRHATPGIELVSPPPHHDIYSIEDLAQLIYDLKQVKPGVDVSVKLVAEAGVGTVAAGVAKGGADIILISGHSGGTGASPLSSIKNAGVNWELGLAETQQTLVLNGLRGRIRLRTDGGLKTGRDVVMAAMLGADEYSFGTAALVAEGCLMARTCHSNNCPVGIATQRPELRAKFAGTPEQVMHFFLHLAQEVREILASLGVRSLGEITGRCDLLQQVKRGYPEADMFDLSAMIARVDRPGEAPSNAEWSESGMIPHSEFHIPHLNGRLLRDCKGAVEKMQKRELSYAISNRDRTVGATLAGTIAARYGNAGLPEGTVTVSLKGSAGQSFGAFLTSGLRFFLEGEANDYVCKGMAGGEVSVYPPARATYASHESAIMGNTVLYGATGGALYAAGRAGERFAVRNSGAVAVVEGVGDHGCEYMTGGVVAVLGQTGRNFAAGMTGGVAYVFDQAGTLGVRCNQDTVALGPLDTEDEEIVLLLLTRHLERTASRRADELILAWHTAREHFRRVQPRKMGAARLPHMLRGLRDEAIETLEDTEELPSTA